MKVACFLNAAGVELWRNVSVLIAHLLHRGFEFMKLFFKRVYVPFGISGIDIRGQRLSENTFQYISENSDLACQGPYSRQQFFAARVESL